MHTRLLPALIACWALAAWFSAGAAPGDAVCGPAPLEVQFNAHSLGLEGALAYRWDFGDGQSAADPAPLHIYRAAGQYVARLTVTAESGQQASADVAIIVEEPPHPEGDVNGDGKADILDLLFIRDRIGASSPGPAPVPAPREGWQFVPVWDKLGITTPKSAASPFAQRAQVWDLGQAIPLSFSGHVEKPQGAAAAWTCTLRNYWGELLKAESGEALVGPGGAVAASAEWLADRLGTFNVRFECEGSYASLWLAVIRPLGPKWDAPGNPFGAMAMHPAYEEYEPYLDLQRRAGMKTLRVELATQSAAPDRERLDTAYLDDVIDPLNARGFRALLLVTYFPDWMKQDGAWKPEWESIDARIDWFAGCVGRIAAYCKTKGVCRYEIWNEPNDGNFWPWGDAKYLELLRKAALAARAADPDCIVLNGGLHSLPGSFSAGIGRAVIDGPNRADCDAVAGHYYRTWGGYSPEHPSNSMLRGFREAVERAASAGKPTWDTESAYGYFYQGEWEAMNWYTRQCVYMLAAGVRQITLYGFANAKEKLGYTSTWWHNFFGLLANNQLPTFTWDNWPTPERYRDSADCFVYTPLPGFAAFSAAVHELSGAEGWTQAALPEPNFAFVYTAGGSTRAVAWRGGEDCCTDAAELVRGVRIGLPPAAIRDVFGNAIDCSVLPLGPSPVYVVFEPGVTPDAAKAAIEQGEIEDSPGIEAGSFNRDFLAEKLRRRTAGMPGRWRVLDPVSDAARGRYNAVLPAELAIATRGSVKMGGVAYAWRMAAASIEANSSRIDLAREFAPDSRDKTTVLYAAFTSPEARRGRIHFMASEDVRIWVNGREMAGLGPRGPCQPNRFSAPGHPDGLGINWGVKPGLFDVRQGRNIVVVKIHGAQGQFGLCFRIAWENFDTMNDLAWQP